MQGRRTGTPIYSLADQAIFTHTGGLDSQQLLYTHLLDEETEAEREKVAYHGAGRQAQVSSCFVLFPVVALPCSEKGGVECEGN